MERQNSFEPIYTDIHIHTSENPDEIKNGNLNYNLESLIENINAISKNCKKLISFSDHNTINKAVYLSSFPNDYYLILGVELHIRFDEKRKPYHCHMLFDLEINEINIDKVNKKLDILYPQKEVSSLSKIPSLEDIVNNFNDYDFLLLPHGGQNHSTFNSAIPLGAKLDNIMERMLYYNQFDGFTSRGPKGTTTTMKYFKKLGIDEFTNLLTCSDNYNPIKYPSPKASKTDFIPTWILAEPTFDGLRLALSEKNRLIYSLDKPAPYEQYIKSYNLQNDKLDINVNFQPGLNVIIGDSSTGKSLLVDTLIYFLNNNIEESKYFSSFDFSNAKIDNPANFIPHYINQNYIMTVASNNKIEDIPIIKRLFGPKDDIELKTQKKINELRINIDSLVNSVESIDDVIQELKKIIGLDELILFHKDSKNPLDGLYPDGKVYDRLGYESAKYEEHFEYLDNLLHFSKNNAFCPNLNKEIEDIKKKLDLAYEKNNFEVIIRNIITIHKKEFDEESTKRNAEDTIKNDNYRKLLYYLSKYIEEKNKFFTLLSKLKKMSYSIKTKPIIISNHQLFVTNSFEISEEVLLEVFNNFLLVGKKIDNFDSVQPENLFLDNYNGTYKISSYDILKNKIYDKLVSNNKYEYKIITSNNKKWEELSPGWKTAILTELILQYNENQAPLIIDQPEDNLANSYINDKLINDIKKAKMNKQIIIVTHNATIPILGDAQNVIVCRSIDNKLVIRSNLLEGKIENKPCLEYIAEVTDGGKKSIKKRFKKYNIKKYKEN